MCEYFRAYAQAQGAKNKDPGMTTADRQLAANIKKMWVQFAAAGNPNVKGVVDWPAYKPDTDRYLEVDLPLAAKSGYSRLEHKPAPSTRGSE